MWKIIPVSHLDYQTSAKLLTGNGNVLSMLHDSGRSVFGWPFGTPSFNLGSHGFMITKLTALGLSVPKRAALELPFTASIIFLFFNEWTIWQSRIGFQASDALKPAGVNWGIIVAQCNELALKIQVTIIDAFTVSSTLISDTCIDQHETLNTKTSG